MKLLTLEDLKAMQPDIIFNSGTIENNPEGIDTESLSWVAVRGGIYDWAIYAAPGYVNFDWISKHGDKVYDEHLIKKLVPCDEEAFGMYRY